MYLKGLNKEKRVSRLGYKLPSMPKYDPLAPRKIDENEPCPIGGWCDKHHTTPENPETKGMTPREYLKYLKEKAERNTIVKGEGTEPKVIVIKQDGFFEKNKGYIIGGAFLCALYLMSKNK